MHLPSQISKAISMLEAAGYSAFTVGGCVRDRLRGAVPEDYDLTTSALPEQVEAVFCDARIIETGLKHGTVTVIIDGTPIEITTFRREGSYSDSRHPDSVIFTDRLEDDLMRRDFTINAMAYNPDRGLVDCFGGQADLEKGLIRCVGNPDRRFKEDALRIMRALRFSSCLGFEIEDKTRQAVFDNMELLKNISMERIRDELLKLLCGRDVRRILTEYPQVIGVFIPELLPMIGFDQMNIHHIYDVLEHTAVVVENAPPEPMLRLTALLHDIGKPAVFTRDSGGVGHFYGHGQRGCEMSRAILDRLRIDTATKEKILVLVLRHDDRIDCSETAVRQTMRELGSELFFQLLDIKRADNKAQNIAEFNHLSEYDELERIGRKILDEHQCFTLSGLCISGNDVIQLGLEGREIGRMLELLLDAVITGKVENNRGALLEYIKEQAVGIS